LRSARGEPVLQLRRHAEEHRAALAGELARPPARLERDGEAGSEESDGDVVEAAAGAADLVREAALQLAWHSDEDILARRC
jgi:hypothetical protein